MLSSADVTEPVTVRTYLGAFGAGDAHGAPVDTVCQLSAARKLVRSSTGEEVVSETTIRLDPDTDPTLDLEALFVPESLVTVRGRTSTVVALLPHLDVGQLVYVEVNLT